MNAISIQNDELEPIATISTEPGYTNKGRFTDPVRSDDFLRAFVSKSTGETRFQVYQEVHYGFQRRNFRNVNYATPDGPQSAELTPIMYRVHRRCGGSGSINA